MKRNEPTYTKLTKHQNIPFRWFIYNRQFSDGAQHQATLLKQGTATSVIGVGVSGWRLHELHRDQLNLG